MRLLSSISPFSLYFGDIVFETIVMSLGFTIPTIRTYGVSEIASAGVNELYLSLGFALWTLYACVFTCLIIRY
jgi:hypothetical protein